MTIRPVYGTPASTSFAVELVALAGLAPRQLILTVGAGAGEQGMAAKTAQPDASVIVMKCDHVALTRVRSHARALGMVIRFDLARPGQLPYGERTFDRVLLPAPAPWPGVLAELRRLVQVLRVGGQLHLLAPKAQAPAVQTALESEVVRLTLPPQLGALAHLCVERR